MTAERWIILGDSIQAHVYGPGTVHGDQSRLTAAQLPRSLNIAINNLSSPGARLTDGGQAGFGASSNKNAITMVRGYAPMTGIIITLGTNDWTNPGTSGQSLLDCYRGMIQHCVSLGMIVVGVSPINRADGANGIQHFDGGIYPLSQFQYWIEAVCQEQAVLLGNDKVKMIQGGTCPITPAHLADGLHLNEIGHDVFCAWLIQSMRALGLWTTI
jgi:lysophospholipase L1-like esterase